MPERREKKKGGQQSARVRGEEVAMSKNKKKRDRTHTNQRSRTSDCKGREQDKPSYDGGEGDRQADQQRTTKKGGEKIRKNTASVGSRKGMSLTQGGRGERNRGGISRGISYARSKPIRDVERRWR